MRYEKGFDLVNSQTVGQIKDAFTKQYSEAVMNPAKTLDGHIANENNVTNDYRGRVLFEFFQNAVDRAESDIWIVMDSKKKTLTFANNGQPFSIEKSEGRKYSDFESLCSINTSSKNQNESIGNKGVGFKSCWEFTNRTTIVSKCGETRWGFELKNPCTIEDILLLGNTGIKSWCETTGVSEVIEKHDGNLPSFYFPRMLEEEDIRELTNGFGSEVSTIITLHGINECEGLIKKIKEFSEHELFFVKQLCTLRNKDFTLHIQVDDFLEKKISTHADETKWLNGNVIEAKLSESDIEELQKLSKAMNYEISNPRVAIAFPITDREKDTLDAKFYTYLPTEVMCGFNVLIHADFLLDVSRKNIDFKDNIYNKKLLEHAAVLLVKTLKERTDLHNLEHFSKFLIPHDKSDPLAKLVWTELIKDNTLTEILRAVYSNPVSETSCKLAFDVMEKWKSERGYGEWKEGYYKSVYNEVLKYFCNPEIKIVCVGKGAYTSLPPRPKSKSDEKRKLFYVAKKGVDLESFSLLRSLDSVALSNMDELSKPEFIADNRIVLPNSKVEIFRALSQESRGADNDEIQRDIIAYIIAQEEGYSGQLNVVHFTAQGSNPKEGHFLASIQLPCKSNQWHSAKQCYFDLPDVVKESLDGERFFEVDKDEFSKIVGANVSLPSVLRYFGATNHLPIEKTNNNKTFILPWNTVPEIEGTDLKELINKAMDDWLAIPDIQPLYELLKKSQWFYDEKNIFFCSPVATFLFNDEIARPAIAQERRKVHLHDFYSKLGIESIEDTVDNEKLLNQLDRLYNDWQSRNQICKLHKTIYKQITLRLSRNKADEKKELINRIKNIPLLTEIGYVEKNAWFADRDAKKFKHYFNNLNFLIFDDEVRKAFIDNIERIKIFSPEFELEPTEELEASELTAKAQTVELKQFIEDEYLADIFAVAEEAMPVNQFLKEAALLRWQNLNIYYADDVWIDVCLNDTSEVKPIGKGEKDRDVFFLPISENERNTYPERIGRLVHDLAEPRSNQNFPKFGEAIANGVFRNINLGPLLRSFLTEALKGDDHRKSFLNERGISDSDVVEMKEFIQEELLNKSEKQELIRQLQSICDKVTEGNWKHHDTYENGSDLSFASIRNKISGKRFQNVIKQLDPSPKNLQQIKNNKQHIQLCHFVEQERQLSNESFEGILKKIKKSNKRELEYYDFALDSVKYFFEVSNLKPEEATMQDAKNRLANRVDSFDHTPVVSDSIAKTTHLKEIVSAKQKTTVVQKTSHEYEQQTKRQQQRGIAAERAFCIGYAKNIFDDDLIMSALFKKIKSIYAESGFKQYLDLIDQADPNNMDQVIDLLHVSKSIGDGLGYDILEPVIDNNGELKSLNKVEVKTSSGGATIYLSQNEYRKILYFGESNDLHWRLYHVVDEKTYDRTSAVLNAAQQFKTEVDNIPTPLALVPDTWVINFEG